MMKRNEKEKKKEKENDDFKAILLANGRLVEAHRPSLKAKLLPGIAVVLGPEVCDGQAIQLSRLHLKHCEPILSTILKTN